MWDFRDLGPDFALKAKNPPINMSGLKFIKYNRPKNRVNVDIGAGLSIKVYQLQPMLFPQLRHL
jgi:hypothetical protein